MYGFVSAPACAHSSRRLRSTILPPSIYTRGTRLLTAQVRPHRARRGPRSHFGRPGRARPPQGFAACGKTLGRRICGGSPPCAHSSRRLRPTVLPPSIYTRGTRLLTAQVRPHRARRGGDPDLILVGQAEPALPKVLPHAAKRLDAASAAARHPALTAAAGSAPRFCRPRYTPAAPACSPRRSARREWCSEWPPGHPPAGGSRRSPPRPPP